MPERQERCTRLSCEQKAAHVSQVQTNRSQSFVGLGKSLLLRLKGPLLFRFLAVFKETAQMRWLWRGEAGSASQSTPAQQLSFSWCTTHIPDDLHSLLRRSKHTVVEKEAIKRKREI